MSKKLRPGSSPDWKQVLLLGEQILNQPTAAAQKETIVNFLETLTGGMVNLWFIEAAYPLAGVEAFGFKEAVSPVVAGALTAAAPVWNADEGELAVSAVPLIAKSEILGVCRVARPAEKPLDESEMALIAASAHTIATLMSVHLEAFESNRRFEQLALVRSVSFQIANVLDLDELARRVTSLILNTFKYYYVAILTLDPGASSLTIRASAKSAGSSATSEERPHNISVQMGEGIVGTVAQTGDELVSPDVQQEARYHYVDALPETRSEAALPLKIESRVLGVLDVQSDQPDAFSDMDVLVLRALADNIALAIEGARLYNAARHRAEQISSVAEISRAITVILDQDKLLREVVEVIHKRFGFPYVYVYTVHAGRRKIFFQAGTGEHSQKLLEEAFTYDLDDPLGIIPSVARSGKTLLSNDVSDNPLFRENPLAPQPAVAELALPLVYGGDTLGVLDIQTTQPAGFDLNDQALFETLADNIAIALRNAILYRAESWRRQVAESLRDVAGLLSANAAPEQVMDSILTELERNLPCDVAAIWLADDTDLQDGEKAVLHLAGLHGSRMDETERIRELTPETDYWLQRAFKEGLPLIRTPNSPIGPLGTVLGFPDDYSSIVVPLRTGDQTLGILALAHHTSGRYGSEAQSMTATFASYAAVAIENTKLYSSAQEQAWISTILLQVAEATQSQNTVEELAETMVRLMPLLVGVEGCAMFQWEPNQEVFELTAAYGAHPAERITNRLMPADYPAFEQLLETRGPVFINDPEIELNLPPTLVAELQLETLLMLPLLARSEILGSLLITYNSQGTPDRSAMSDKRLAIIQGIAQQIAIALENIRLLESKQEDAYVTAVMLQVAQAVVSMNDLDDILEAIVHIMPILVGIDCCIIYLWDPLREAFRSSHVYCGSAQIEGEVMLNHYSREQFPLLDHVAHTDTPLMLALEDPRITPLVWRDIPLPDGNSQDFSESAGLLMAFPLSVKGDVFGVMLAQEAGSNHEFREKRLEILTGIAQQAALAIQNDRLNKEMVGRERLEREFQLAREIQQTFLPSSLPDLPNWDMDVRWRTARQVGGDFYDVFELPGDRLGVVIADVSDKGMPAALYMTVTRTLIRATVTEIESPARVLEHVNDLLLMNSQNGMFVTTFYGILDIRSGQLTYANAGHNLPLLLRPTRTSAEPLVKGGTVLGALEDIKLEDHTVQIEPDECLLLYTDGVTESFSPEGENYGEERLIASLSSAQYASVSQLLDQIDVALTEFRQGGPPNDDITLLALHRLATPKLD